MKVAESKTKSSAATTTAAKTSNTPFFSKETQGASAFFGGETAEAEPFFSPRTIQPKLTIGKPNDHYEQQADAVADQVMAKLNSPTPSVPPTPKGSTTAASTSTGGNAIQAKCDHCEQEEKLQKKEEDITPVGEQVQMKPIFDSAAEPPPDDNVQRKCADCEKEEAVQRKTDGNTEGVASSDLSSRLSASKGGGQPLPNDTRASMESAMGADFSNVRVHTGSEAVRMSQGINAQAFTHGSDVYFNEGKYDTGSSSGQHLLAHELTHTVQQSHNTDQVQDKKIQQEVTKNNNAETVQTKLEVNSQHLFEGEVVSNEQPNTAEQSDKGGASPSMGKTETPGESRTSKEGDESSRENETTTNTKGDSSTTANTNTNSSTSSSGAATSPNSPNNSTSAPSATTSPNGNNSASNVEGNGSTTANVSPNARASAVSGPQGNGTTNTPASSPQGNDAANTPAASSCTPQCYKGQREEPAEKPEQRPMDSAATQVETEASKGEEEDLPELDNCPATPANAATAAPGTSGSPQTSAPQTSAASAGNGSAKAADGGSNTPQESASAANDGALEGGASAVGDQSLAGLITSAESQRGIAVSAYEQSSSSLKANTERTATLRTGIPIVAQAGESLTIQGQRRLAASRAERFFSGIANKLDTATTQALLDTPDQLGLAAESGKAQISAAIETQKTSISTRIKQARKQAVVDAAMAKSEVRLQTATFVADVASKTAAAIKNLTTTHRKTMSKVDDLETSTLSTVNSVYSVGRTDLEGLGTKIGAECTTKGEAFATIYRGFSNCTENGFWDGDLSGRRANAQANAAREVAKAYHDRMVEAANKRAREVTRNGRKADRCSIIDAASKSRDTLDGQLPGLINAFETTRDGAIQQARAKERQLLSSINSSLSATLRQLDQQERSQRQSVNDTGYMQQVLQEQIAFAAAAAVQQGVQTAITSVQDAMLDVQSRFASGNTPEIGVLEGVFGQVEQKISTAMDGLNVSASTGATAAENQLVGASQQAITSLEGITQSNDESTTTLSGGFGSSMSVIAGTDHFATQRTSITTQIKRSEKASVAALTQIFDGFKESCETTLKGAHTALEKAHKSLELNLRQSKQGLECEMTHKANEAASKEAPAWKRALAVLLVIIVIIIVIVVIVATAGAGLGILAAAAIGAAVGAVTSGLLYLASNLWSNQDITLEGLGKAVLIGAVTGFIGGGIGAAAGAGVGVLFQGASKAVQLAAQFGAAMISAGGMDVVTQYVMGGFSFKHFSKGQLGITFLVTAVTFGIGHVAGGRVGVPNVESPGGGVNAGGTPETVPTATGTPETVPTATGTPETVSTATGTPETVSTATGTPETVPTATGTPETVPTATGTPETVPTATGTPETVPTATGTPETVPTATDTPETVPTATDTPETVPAATDTPETVPTATDTPETVPTATDTPETVPTATDTPETVPTATDTPETVPSTADTPELTPAEKRARIIRQDDDFNALLNRKGVPKSHLEDGAMVPANPDGETTPLEHIYGSQPAKGESPYTSFLTEEGGIAAKPYGATEVELDVPRLQADIAEGRVTGIEVLTPADIEMMIRADIEAVAPGVDADAGIANGAQGIDDFVAAQGLSKSGSARLARRLLALHNTTRDGEYLIRGIIPNRYLHGPNPTSPPN